MVSYKIHELDQTKLVITGNSYNFKEQIKLMGGKWNSKQKIWIIDNIPENIKIVNKMKTPKRCGYCGECGHTQLKCQLKLTREASKLCKNPGKNFKKLDDSEYCKCEFIDKSYGIPGFSVKIPKICVHCNVLCCKFAKPLNNASPLSVLVLDDDFSCPYHGTGSEQFLNDTRGT